MMFTGNGRLKMYCPTIFIMPKAGLTYLIIVTMVWSISGRRGEALVVINVERLAMHFIAAGLRAKWY